MSRKSLNKENFLLLSAIPQLLTSIFGNLSNLRNTTYILSFCVVGSFNMVFQISYSYFQFLLQVRNNCSQYCSRSSLRTFVTTMVNYFCVKYFLHQGPLPDFLTIASLKHTAKTQALPEIRLCLMKCCRSQNHCIKNAVIKQYLF